LQRLQFQVDGFYLNGRQNQKFAKAFPRGNKSRRIARYQGGIGLWGQMPPPFKPPLSPLTCLLLTGRILFRALVECTIRAQFHMCDLIDLAVDIAFTMILRDQVFLADVIGG
jgi:hypothetical protein